MFLQEEKDRTFSRIAFSLMHLVRELNENSIELSSEDAKIEFEDWYNKNKTILETLCFSNYKSAWCWARMIERNIDHKQPRMRMKTSIGKCQYCKVADAKQIDHIWPLSLGGPMDDSRRNEWNFIFSCQLCNSIKGNAPLSCTVRDDFLSGLVTFAIEIYGHEFDRL